MVLGSETRFCPYCAMSQFQVEPEAEGTVHCEVCGVDVPIRELIQPPE
ncbi:MAG: hypothetical protein HYY54_02685 [candidate division NC10 bacterium]|nr:hypothetical protein [candidate division NC10 bacterium]MBI4390861.1 hypothetical protein [candidate division NC10 bacterium]